MSESVRCDHPGVIAPPPLIPLAALLLGLALDWLVPLPLVTGLLGTGLTGFMIRKIFAGLLFWGGLVMVIAAGHIFKRAATNIPPWKPALHLATGGIYQYVRNPMYVGFFLIAAGIAVALASVWSLILLVPAAYVLHHGVVLREERYLTEKFGEDYCRYTAHVPRYGLPFRRV